MQRVLGMIQLNIERLTFEVTSTGRLVEDLLGDEFKDFNPLFVWCMARRKGLDALVTKHDEWAKYMFQSPMYKTAYGKVFPEVFNGQ